MNIASVAQASADRWPRLLKSFTDKRSVWLVATAQGFWSLFAAFFASGRGATVALVVNAAFSGVTYLQVKAREWLALAGEDMPAPAEPPHDDGTAADDTQ